MTDQNHTPNDLIKQIKDILKAKLTVAGHDAWEGHYYYVGGIDDAAKTIAEAFSTQSALVKARECR